jgi:glycosyltransferase involved in cell wall biosynthesis
MANAVSFDGTWWDALFRQIGVDGVWCNLVECAAHVKFSGTGTFELAGRPWVAAAHNYVIHESLPYPMASQEHVAMQQILGAQAADANVINSDHCRAMLFDNVGRWFSDEIRQRIERTEVKINYGPLADDLPPPPDERKTREIPTIAYNHRLQGYKQFGVTFEILEELWQEGVKFRLKLFQNTTENTTKLLRYDWAELVLSETHDRYLTALRDCDLNITHSLHETFCISAVESMAFGQPLIAPDGVTFREITGVDAGNKGYPFLFKSREESKDMIRKALTDRTFRTSWGNRCARYVRASFSESLWVERYVELFERLQGERQPNPKPDSAAAFADFMRRNPGPYTTRQLHNAINAGLRVKGRQPFSNQSLTLTKLVRLVRDGGGSVTVNARGQQICHG